MSLKKAINYVEKNQNEKVEIRIVTNDITQVAVMCTTPASLSNVERGLEKKKFRINRHGGSSAKPWTATLRRPR